MKKDIIDFSKVRYARKRLAPMLNSKRMGYAVGQTSRCYRSDGEDEDEQKELLKKIQKSVEKQLETRASKEDVETITRQLSFLTKGKNEKGESVSSEFPIEALRSMADEKTGVMAKLIEQGLEIQQLKAAGERQIKRMDVRSQVAEWQEKHKDALLAVIEGRSKTIPALNIRAAASPMLVSTVNSGSSPYIGRTEVEAGVNGFLRNPNTFWDFLPKGRTSAQTYVWVNKSNPQGAAGFIGPGVAKPGISLELVAENSVVKKIADSAKAGTELLNDIDGMTTFIEQELREQVFLKINSTLMNNAGSSTVPKGIQNYSFLYSAYPNAAAIKTTNPTFVDALRAVVGQLRSGALQGDIDIFINSIDAANMDIAKANNSGVYILPPFVTSNGMNVAGARIHEDNNVAVGSFQAGFLKYYRVLLYEDFSITWGWENDDFTKNLVTAVGEVRMHQFVNSLYSNSGAFCYDSFQNVLTAITQA